MARYWRVPGHAGTIHRPLLGDYSQSIYSSVIGVVLSHGVLALCFLLVLGDRDCIGGGRSSFSSSSLLLLYRPPLPLSLGYLSSFLLLIYVIYWVYFDYVNNLRTAHSILLLEAVAFIALFFFWLEAVSYYQVAVYCYSL